MNHYHMYRIETDAGVFYENGFNEDDALENLEAEQGQRIKPRRVRKARRDELIDGARNYVR